MTDLNLYELQRLIIKNFKLDKKIRTYSEFPISFHSVICSAINHGLYSVDYNDDYNKNFLRVRYYVGHFNPKTDDVFNSSHTIMNKKGKDELTKFYLEKGFGITFGSRFLGAASHMMNSNSYENFVEFHDLADYIGTQEDMLKLIYPNLPKTGYFD